MSSVQEDTNEMPAAGATIVWFGKHQGVRLDELPDGYRAWAVYSDIAQNYGWHRTFAELNQQYLEERLPSLKPDDRPGNQRRSWTKSQPFRVLYNDRKWRAWCHKVGNQQKPYWYWEFLDLENQFTSWLETHRRPYQKRRQTVHINKVGQKCGPWDDKIDAVPENDQYDLEDDFIDDSNVPDAEDDDDYTDHDVQSASGVVESQDADCNDATVDCDSEEEVSQGTQNEADSAEEEDGGAIEGDTNTYLSTPRLRGPRVIEIPGGETIREAKDLFNDEIGLPGPLEVAHKQLSGSPDTPRTRSVAPRKRAYRVDPGDLDDSDQDVETPARQKRRVAVDDGASDDRQATEAEERLSQVALQTPPRSGRRSVRGGTGAHIRRSSVQ